MLVDLAYSLFRFWWQPLLTVAAVYLVLNKGLVQPRVAVTLFIVAVAYRYIIVAGLFDIAAMTVFDRWPKQWRVAEAQRFGPKVRRPSWGWLLLAQSRLLYTALSMLLVAWAIRWVQSRSAGWIAVAIVIVLAITGVARLSILAGYGTAARRCSILLLRKFGDVPGWQSRSGLVPGLTALGEVTTAHDEGLDKGGTENPEEPPETTLVHPDKESMRNWREEIARLITTSDFVVIDVSHPSPSIAWEITQAYQLARTKTLLVVDAEQLGIQHWDLHEQLRREVDVQAKPSGLSGFDMLTSFPAPLAYSKGLMSIVFDARLIQITRQSRQECDASNA